MRFIAGIFLLLINFNLRAQTNIPACPTVDLFIKGHPYREKFEPSFFEKDFQLALSDSSYSIVSFMLVWDHGNYINERAERSNTVRIKHPTNERYNLVVDTNCTITLEKIKIQKNGDTCQIRVVALFVTSKTKADEDKEFIPCVARLPGYARDPVVYARIFLKDFSLELSDPSYTITSFDLTYEDFETLELFAATIKGNHVSITRPDVIRVLSHVRPGRVVVCENITVTKDGKVYKVRPLLLYVK